MWSRVVEFMLGCWLAMSPFIFRHPADEPFLWWNDFGAALAVMVLSLASYASFLHRAHLGIILVAGWLVGHAWWTSGHPASPAAQNDLMTGLLLLMFAVVPSEASRPPRAWRPHDPLESGTSAATGQRSPFH